MNPRLSLSQEPFGGPATEALVGGSVYGEEVENGWREWSPGRSKLADFVAGGGGLPVERGDAVLYLGAGSGTTLSHLSDLVDRGVVYGVEHSYRPTKTLLKRLEGRRNVVPLLRDARRPKGYAGTLELVDLLYQDVSQKGQAGIAARNAEAYLKEEGVLMLMLKTRSEDVTAETGEVVEKSVEELESKGFEVEEVEVLESYPDHGCLVGRYRP